MIKFIYMPKSYASTASDKYESRMLRSGGAGSNILKGLSSRRTVLLFRHKTTIWVETGYHAHGVLHGTSQMVDNTTGIHTFRHGKA